MTDKKIKTPPKKHLDSDVRRNRFIETARAIGASESAEDFDKAFAGVTKRKPIPAKTPKASD